MGKELKMLCEPIRVGPMLMKNRIAKSATWTRTASVEGEVTQQTLDLYESFARGGAGMIMIEGIAVHGGHTWLEPQIRIDDPKYMPGLRRLVDIIHMNDSLCEFQLMCSGAFGTDPISPSGVPSYASARTHIVEPRMMSLAECEEMRDLFIAAAVRSKAVGCDGVLIHAATSYLLQQFNSPHSNKRTDRYGGSLEGRVQIHLEIIRGIRQKCGPSFGIGCSITANELQPDGIIMEDAVAFARILEREGVDHIDYSIGTYETQSSEGGRGASFRQPKGAFEYAEAFKKEVRNLKIFARPWGQQDPVKWEEALQKGQCDVIQGGRSLLSDPDLPRKVTEGRLDDIRLCTRCGMCVEYGAIREYQIACAQNPELAKEKEYAIRITSTPKKVVVVGGGPGGMEAARVAALQGHNVTLIEKESELGGNAIVAAVPTGKEDLKDYFIAWLARQCEKAGVKIELNKKATPAVIARLKPDVVIVATGASPLLPAIPGIDKPHVVTAADVLMGRRKVKGNVIIIGGGEVGVETADYIAEKGVAKSVVIVEMLPVIGADMTAKNKDYIVDNVLRKLGVKMYTNLRVTDIKDGKVIATDREWNKREFEADTVVNAMGYVANTGIYEALSGKVPRLYRIGDCIKPRKMLDAVHEAAYIARQI